MYKLSYDKDSTEKKLNSQKVNKTHGPDQLHVSIAVYGQR